MTKTAVIINSTASRAHKSVRTIEKNTQKHGISQVVFTEAEDFKSKLAELLRKRPDLLIIGGGDGTVISAIDFALKQKFSGTFGIIPLGTSNYLARNLRLSLNPSTALRQSIKGTVNTIHLGKANDNLFALMTDLGASVHVSKAVTYDQKKRFGQIAYLLSTLKALKNHSPFGYAITYDTDGKMEGFCHNILVVNSNLSRQVPLAPDSKLDKDTLTVSVYTGKNNLALLLNVFLYIITLGNFKRGIKEFTAKKLEIRTLPHQDYSVDGEVKQKTPLAISLLDKKIPVMTPKSFKRSSR